jgi:hypothetical protein
MTDTRQVTYEGAAPFASVLVRMLEDEGVTVQWDPPEETRSGGVLEEIVIGLAVNGTYEAIKLGVDRFRQWAKGRAKAKIDGEPDDGGFY